MNIPESLSAELNIRETENERVGVEPKTMCSKAITAYRLVMRSFYATKRAARDVQFTCTIVRTRTWKILWNAFYR